MPASPPLPTRHLPSFLCSIIKACCRRQGTSLFIPTSFIMNATKSLGEDLKGETWSSWIIEEWRDTNEGPQARHLRLCSDCGCLRWRLHEFCVFTRDHKETNARKWPDEWMGNREIYSSFLFHSNAMGWCCYLVCYLHENRIDIKIQDVFLWIWLDATWAILRRWWKGS